MATHAQSRSPADQYQDPALNKGETWVSKGEYLKAYEAFSQASRSPVAKNAQAVCLMRLGRFEEAIPILRELVMQHGCTWVRSDVPAHFKANYAAALFYGGLPSGSLQVLSESNIESHPSVIELRQAINGWTAQMSFWQRLNWNINRIAPKLCPEAPTQVGEFNL